MPAHQNYMTVAELANESNGSLLGIAEGIGGYTFATRERAAYELARRGYSLDDVAL